MSISINKEIITNFTDFEPETLTFTEPKCKNVTDEQLVGFARYNSGVLGLQTPWIKLDSGGIPRHHLKYFPNDIKRSQLIFPLNSDDKLVNSFRLKLKEVDNNMETTETKSRLFKDNSEKYVYNPCVKEKDEEPRKDKNGNSWPTHDTLKTKLNLSISGDQIESFKTKVFLSKESDETDKKGKPKRIRTPLNYNSIDELTEYIKLGAIIRAVIKPKKLWAQKPSKKKNEISKYGITWSVEKIEIEESSIQKRQTAKFDSDKFADDDDDDDEIPLVNNKPLEQLNSDSDDNAPSKSSKNPISKVIDNYEESDDSDDNDNKTLKKPVKKILEESDSDSDDEKSQKKLQLNVVNIDSDSDSDTDSDKDTKSKSKSKKVSSKTVGMKKRG